MQAVQKARGQGAKGMGPRKLTSGGLKLLLHSVPVPLPCAWPTPLPRPCVMDLKPSRLLMQPRTLVLAGLWVLDDVCAVPHLRRSLRPAHRQPRRLPRAPGEDRTRVGCACAISFNHMVPLQLDARVSRQLLGVEARQVYDTPGNALHRSSSCVKTAPEGSPCLLPAPQTISKPHP